MQNYLEDLKNCNFCPRNCNADRAGEELGFCNSDSSLNIASICIHHGEEPVISGKNGICNVFFSHCNLQCIYCQNYQISKNNFASKQKSSLQQIVLKIISLLDKTSNMLGFVSPSHCIPQMKAIINAIHQKGRRPVIVFNTNAYDKVETLQSIEGLIDVYLPDFKYSNNLLSTELSDAENYPEIALKAIKEMVRQKGTSLRLNDDGQAESGVIIRHLVLPENIENSKKVLQLIANDISTNMHTSLMSQYFPIPDVFCHPKIGKNISKNEYNDVINEMKKLGFYRGWTQKYQSSEFYRPDFFKTNPFE